MAIIEVEHVTKEFRLGQMQSLKTALLNGAQRLLGQPTEKRASLKALDDVTFSVNAGEVVGIIGHNGAGKSTLLKLLSGITPQTRGRVAVGGTIAPLIEVGAGFLPDFTGRENLYLNGAILGMPKKSLARKFDEIVAFAELQDFIDTPIKRYSSGMQVRLAFALATSMDADILIVDEVLAVGDLAFQRKCFDRIDNLIRRAGKTVLLVSHNIRQIERLCSRVLLMDHGKIEQDGVPRDVCNAFYEASDSKIRATRQSIDLSRTKSSGDIEILSVGMLSADQDPLDTVSYLQEVEFRIHYRLKSTLRDPIFSIGIHTTDFFYLANSQSVDALSTAKLEPGMYVVRYRIPRFPFLPGIYFLRLGVALGGSFQGIFYSENVMPIQVIAPRANRATVSEPQEGFIDLGGEWELLSEEFQATANAERL